MAIKFTTERNILLSAITPALRAVGTKSNNPAVCGLLFALKGDELSICGYDTEKGICSSAKVDGRGDGSVILNAAKISAIIKSLPDCVVTFDASEKDIVSITGADSTFSIYGLNASQFPSLPDINAEPEITIKASILRDMIFSTSYAVAAKSTKPIFLGELFDISGWNLKLVAADFCRIAVKTASGCVTGADGKFIVPGKALNDLARLTSNTEKGIGISLTRKHIIFHCENMKIFSKLIEGDFFDYEKAIPQTSATNIKVSRQSLVSAIERASIIIDDKLKTPLKVRFSGNYIDISSESSYGRSSESIKADISGDEITMGFNHKYLLEALKTIQDDEIKMSTTSELKPLVINGENYTHLLLPLRLK